MKLTPMRPMFRSSTVGCSCALVLVVGFIAWRGLHEHDLGGTALGFAIGAVGFAALGVPLMLWWLRRSADRAEAMPADAELTSRGRWNWRFLALGAFVGVNAVVRGLDDQVAVAGALAGMVLGGAVIFGSGLLFLGRWEGEHGRELLQKRAWRGTEYFFRDLHPSASHRFTRERETVSTH